MNTRFQLKNLKIVLQGNKMQSTYDLLVVGSGIAGLYTAIRAKEKGANVLLITKGGIEEATTKWAQGGIAAAVGASDSIESHLKDTVDAGAGLVDIDAAKILVEGAPERIDDLIRYGVRFDRSGGFIQLGREAAHSAPRILHARGDQTGLEIELSLSSLAQESGITILEHTLVRELKLNGQDVVGAEVLSTKSGNKTLYGASKIVLATGGAGQMYSVTTNPEVSTGDGVALAYMAGAEIMDMEFTQFHPTALCIKNAPTFLISEALRGEGALLFNSNGKRYMPEYHSSAELAPRDIVSRSTLMEMKETADDHVLLDVTSHNVEFLQARFPNIYKTCMEYGIDISKDRIPVAPAAHYTIGGIRTNTWGETSLNNLFAVGEVACTGVHGANRLASNSLLETVIFASRTIEHIFRDQNFENFKNAADDELYYLDSNSRTGEIPNMETVRELMWDYVGLERTGDSLDYAVKQLTDLRSYTGLRNDRKSIELNAILICGSLAAHAAYYRRESRGAHYRADYPKSDKNWQKHIIFKHSNSDGRL